jgi:hypothetical protein
VPRISAFYGIAIYMYYRDHAPPHFQVDKSEMLEGRLPRRARSLVVEWATVHQDELLQTWELARAGQPLPVIAGLD